MPATGPATSAGPAGGPATPVAASSLASTSTPASAAKSGVSRAVERQLKHLRVGRSGFMSGKAFFGGKIVLILVTDGGSGIFHHATYILYELQIRPGLCCEY